MAQNAGVAGGWLADQISLGVLASSCSDAVDEVVAAAGRAAKRSNGKPDASPSPPQRSTPDNRHAEGPVGSGRGAGLKKNHSYDVPEVVALLIVGGSTDYVSWVSNETRPV
jgi:hypothetical protein